MTTYANDPRIVAARTLAEAIDAKIGRGALAKSSVDNLCPGNGEATRTRFADDGRTVKLELVERRWTGAVEEHGEGGAHRSSRLKDEVVVAPGDAARINRMLGK